ncbi:MAG TPA: RagB/SusD family nutrient uptake outer membrane protein [Longimicrobiaceae bacterium]|nr:RagB/SusD family nutrient uptake outer membrane protein [Longimicrobiaceae bacterium]
MQTYSRSGRRAWRGAVLATLLGAAFLGGCGDLTVPDYNNPSIEDLRSNPTPAGVRAAATGLLVGARANISAPNAYVSLLGILGRESYNFDPSDPRFITEMLAPELNPGSPAFGANLWALRYRNIQNAVILLGAVDQVGEFSPAQKEAIRGFAKTIMALDFLLIVNTRDVAGVVIDVDRPLDAGPGELVDRAAGLAHVVKLLDEAAVHLQAAGGGFPFPLSAGFSGFNTPSTFLSFNRALKARAEVYRRQYASALTALENSFVSATAPLDRGVYHVYGTGSGETSNGLVASTIFAHPSVMTEAQRQPGGALDRRVQEKVKVVEPVTQQGFTSNLKFTIYDDPTDPIPVITNEELLLLRAEARWFTGNRPGALEDLNLIRQRAGGLAPIAMPATDAAFVTALLRERFYSLLFEGHRWIDLRRFNQLPAAWARKFPIPEAECLARERPTPCDLQ